MDRETGSGQTFADQAREQGILEAATTEHDMLRLPSPSPGHGQVRQCSVETVGKRTHLEPLASFRKQGIDQGSRIRHKDFPFPEAPRESHGIRTRGRRELQFHGRLTLEPPRASNSNKGRNRIKKPTHAGRARTIRTPFQHGSQQRPFSGRKKSFHGIWEPRAAEFEKQPRSTAAWLLDCLVATRQRELAQMTKTLEALVIDQERFPAPDRAIGSEPGTIPSQTQNWTDQAPFRHHRGDMSMMMLHTDQEA
jgi:hypothetical protein